MIFLNFGSRSLRVPSDRSGHKPLPGRGQGRQADFLETQEKVAAWDRSLGIGGWLHDTVSRRGKALPELNLLAFVTFLDL
jgi:hypothetical protein